MCAELIGSVQDGGSNSRKSIADSTVNSDVNTTGRASVNIDEENSEEDEVSRSKSEDQYAKRSGMTEAEFKIEQLD